MTVKVGEFVWIITICFKVIRGFKLYLYPKLLELEKERHWWFAFKYNVKRILAFSKILYVLSDLIKINPEKLNNSWFWSIKI